MEDGEKQPTEALEIQFQENQIQGNARPLIEEIVEPPHVAPLLQQNQNNNQEIPVDVQPQDSVSNISTNSSTVSAIKLKNYAKRASLMIEAANLERKQKLEREQAKVKFKMQQEMEIKDSQIKFQLQRLKLQTEIQQANVVEEICNNFEQNGVLVMPDTSRLHEVPLLPVENVKIEEDRADSPDSIPDLEPIQEVKPLKPNKQYQQTPTPCNDSNIVAQTLADLFLRGISSLKLPPVKLDEFNGDPLKYTLFIKSFKSLIETKESDPLHRLYYLIQYCTGEVRQLLLGCQQAKDVAKSYQEALQLLEDNYGQPEMVIQLYLNKLTDGRPIQRDNLTSLRSFYIDMMAFKNTLEDLGEVDQLNNSRELRKIMEHLPQHMVHEWRGVADRVMREERRKVTIYDACKFTERKVRALDNPLFGINASSQSTTSNQRSRTKNNFSSTSTVVKADKLNSNFCIMCNDDGNTKFHFTNQCKRFRSLTYDNRVKLVKSKKLCFCCLRNDHVASDCKRKKPCIKSGCFKRHTTLLHPPESINSESGLNNVTKLKENQSNYQTDAESLSFSTNCNTDKHVLLPIVPVKVRSSLIDKNVYETYALLDSGSDSTYCSNNLVKILGLVGKPLCVKRSTLTNANEQFKTKVYNNITLSDWSESYQVNIPSVFSQDKIHVSRDSIPTQQDIDQYNYLSKIHVPKLNSEVDLIIGNNASIALEPIDVIASQGNGPFVTKTRLGYAINGCVDSNPSCFNLKSFFTSLEKQRTDLCSLCTDYVDNLQHGKMEPSWEQQQFLTKVKRSIKLDNSQHYQVDLPIKYPEIKMPCNKDQAIQRFQSLQRKFKKDNSYFLRYKKSIDVMINDGYAEEIKYEANNQQTNWFLPHHGVINPKKPEKLRVVFDASAKYKGISLNDNLLCGPDLTSKLLGVLLRFRQAPVAFIADVRMMYYQVHVPLEQRSFLQFLWFDKTNQNQIITYQMKSHIFGATSSPGVANYALKQVATDFKNEISDETASTICHNFYVDDLLKSTETTKEAQLIIKETRHALSKAGFEITKFIANKSEVLNQVSPKDQLVSTQSTLNLLEGDEKHRALGIQWNLSSDQLGYDCSSIVTECKTRRQMLSVLNSIYDPIGILVPLILHGKLILQEVVAQKLDWDENCPQEILDRWNKWTEDIKNLKDFHVNRCMKPTGFGQIKQAELHHFSDASGNALAAASYIKLTNHNGEVHCTLLMAKSRLVPKKKLTIPRLELSAAIISLNLDKFLRKELQIPINRSYFWVDSTTVIHYIQNKTASYQTFVSNRVNKIRDSTNLSQWKYITSKDNVADVASRGLSGKKFLSCSRWIDGPAFLLQDSNSWPEPPITLQDTSEEIIQTGMVTTTNPEPPNEIDNLINKFANWNKLVNVMAYILRFVSKLKSKIKTGQEISTNNEVNIKLTVEEVLNAESFLVIYSQNQEFQEEMNHLSQKKPLKRNSRLIRLNPFLQNNILKVGGRIDKSQLPNDEKHPIILSSKMNISKLIINQYHKSFGHVGRNHVLSHVRSKYWILGGNNLTRKVLNDCYACKKMFGKLNTQLMAELPAQRLKYDEPPFSYTGIDYFGPFSIKIGRSIHKRYGVLFTCLVSRAIHLEVSADLSTNSFLMSLRRFLSRRGNVKCFYSDNGTNFVGAINELQKCINNWNNNQIHDYLLQKRVKWVFNPPAASHFGGVWERLIRSVRKILISLTSNQTFSEEGFQTLLCEIEFIINSRPLTVSSSDCFDLKPISPNDILLNNQTCNLPYDIFSSKDTYSKKRWRKIQFLADSFWQRFKKEYISLLQERQKWCQIKQNLKRNDIVLISNENAPRCNWSLGRVLRVIPDKHGIVRIAEIKTQTGILTRPISKLSLIVENLENM